MLTLLHLLTLHGLVLVAEPYKPIVIAHRGASGYAVEHTEAAKAMAHAQRADFIEQDVVLSKDGQFVVTHDITMNETTDVESRFPNRARKDGQYYFADFDWSELQQLEVHERTRKGSNQAAMPNRFPGAAGQRLVLLTDEIKWIQGWNQTTRLNAGLYIELKSPSFHKQEFGRSMGSDLLKMLAKSGVDHKTIPCYIQCFEMEELVDMHDRLQCNFPLIFLLGKAIEKEELIRVSRFAKGIGPSLELLANRDKNGTIQSTGLVESAKQAGLLVHPYTVRKYAQPKWSKSLDETHSFLLEKLQVDGFFSDYPDLGRKAIDSMGSQPKGL
jgi:glycerophosphoryl diester phosphodiesterase